MHQATGMIAAQLDASKKEALARLRACRGLALEPGCPFTRLPEYRGGIAPDFGDTT